MKNRKTNKNKTRLRARQAKNKKLPKWLQSVLWSYDISEMDIKTDKDLIIQQVLNYGTMEEIQWLFKVYTLRDIKNVLNNPSRGSWDSRVLNYWTKIFKIKTHPIVYEMAIKNLNPQPEKWERWFNFIKKKASKETKERWKELKLLGNSR